jgi:hypothetical protein
MRTTRVPRSKNWASDCDHFPPFTPSSRAVNIRSVQTSGSTQDHLSRISPTCLAPSGTSAGSLSKNLSFTCPPSCVPLLHAHYTRFSARMDALTPARLSCPRAGLPASLTIPSDRSISNHLTPPAAALSHYPSAQRVPVYTGRGFTSTQQARRLRPAESSSSPMDRSFTSCCSPPRFTATQLHSVTDPEIDRPEEDFHLSDIVRSQAH